MAKPKKKAYIAGAIQCAPNLFETFKFYEYLGKIAKEAGYEPFIPHIRNNEGRGLNNHPNIFINDYDGLAESDIVIAWIGAPSTGTGAELAFATQWKKRIIAFYQENESPSPYVIQMIHHFQYLNKNQSLFVYKNKRHCGQLLRKELKKNSLIKARQAKKAQKDTRGKKH